MGRWMSSLPNDCCHLPLQTPPCQGQKREAEGTEQHSYLQDPLVIYFVEDRPVDLVGFEGDPVEHRHAELGLDRLLDFHS